jgi:hypothetical protein
MRFPLLRCLVLTAVLSCTTTVKAENEVGNLFPSAPAPESQEAPIKSPLTEKFTRSRSSEKFNGEKNEKMVFVGNNPSEHMLPADKTPAVRVNPEAPGPFVAMKKAYDEGDLQTANAFADQYVRYMQRVMFEVRELSQMIGEALVRNKVLEEDDWVGVSQYMGREMARNAAVSGEKVNFKATAELALERIQADKSGKAEIYIFCSVTSSYCRQMGPTIERIYRLTKNDPSIKFAVFTIGKGQQEYLKDFKTYTGMTMPIQNGDELAKQFRVSFVPAVVVRAPTTNRAYLRTGLVQFPRFVEFVRTVQGRPVDMTDGEMNLVATPIGAVENGDNADSASSDFSAPKNPSLLTASSDLSAVPQRLQRF